MPLFPQLPSRLRLYFTLLNPVVRARRTVGEGFSHLQLMPDYYYTAI